MPRGPSGAELDEVMEGARIGARAGGAPDVEDVVQDVVLKYLIERAEVDDPGAWANRVARNRAIDIVKKEKRHLFDVPDDESDQLPRLRGRPSTSFTAMNRQMVSQVLAELSDREREVIELRFREGLSAREAADRLGIAAATVDQCVLRARQRIAALFPDAAEVLGAPRLY